ncbi:MAG: hypothetical protein CMH83_15975 [Nocardioides sp.]|nr:hypothetical protein [Nocardioides sp.]
MRPHLHRTAALLTGAVLALGATACSGDGGTDGSGDAPSSDASASATSDDGAGGEDSLRDAIADLYNGPDPDATGDPAEGECFADELIDRLGEDGLVEAGIAEEGGGVVDRPAALDEPTAEAWADATLACSDFYETSAAALQAQSPKDLDEPAYADCLRDAVTEDDVRAALVASLTGALDDPAVTTLSRAQATCADGAVS